MIHKSVSTIDRLRMNFLSKLIHSGCLSWYKVDTELIHKFVLTFYVLRMKVSSQLIHSGYLKLEQSWYRVVTQVCINVLSTPYDFLSNLVHSGYLKLVQSWYRVVTQVCINFLSTPYELFVKVDTQLSRSLVFCDVTMGRGNSGWPRITSDILSNKIFPACTWIASMIRRACMTVSGYDTTWYFAFSKRCTRTICSIEHRKCS